jgi:uncharacterized Tic20 family protein
MMPCVNIMVSIKRPNKMSDTLTVFGIILAVFTYVESLYHSDIDSAIDIYVNDKKRDNKMNYEKVKKILLEKQIPLTVMSLIISIIMIPVGVDIVITSISLIINKSATYDISSVLVVLLNIAFLLISLVQVKKCFKLQKKLKTLEFE